MHFFHIRQVKSTKLIRMERFTLQQCFEIIKMLLKSLVEALKTRPFLVVLKHLFRTPIQNVVDKFESWVM